MMQFRMPLFLELPRQVLSLESQLTGTAQPMNNMMMMQFQPLAFGVPGMNMWVRHFRRWDLLHRMLLAVHAWVPEAVDQAPKGNHMALQAADRIPGGKLTQTKRMKR